jgi:hypothetical protein
MLVTFFAHRESLVCSITLSWVLNFASPLTLIVHRKEKVNVYILKEEVEEEPKRKPHAGVVPATLRLRVSRSTD